MEQAIHKWELIGDALISFTTAGAVPDHVWDAFVNDINTKNFSKFLGTSVGSVDLTSIQRSSASQAMSTRKIPVAVVTDERIVRGIVTAASWLGVNIKAFPWTGIKDAIRHLKIVRPFDEQVYDRIIKMRFEMGGK